MSCPLVRMEGPLEEVRSRSEVHSLRRTSPACFLSLPSDSRLVLQLVDRGHICLGVRLKGTRRPAPDAEGQRQTQLFVFTFANFFMFFSPRRYDLRKRELLLFSLNVKPSLELETSCGSVCAIIETVLHFHKAA